MKRAAIHVGIGGWDFDPWRGTFYPKDLTQKRELGCPGNAAAKRALSHVFPAPLPPAIPTITRS